MLARAYRAGAVASPGVARRPIAVSPSSAATLAVSTSSEPKPPPRHGREGVAAAQQANQDARLDLVEHGEPRGLEGAQRRRGGVTAGQHDHVRRRAPRPAQQCSSSSATASECTCAPFSGEATIVSARVAPRPQPLQLAAREQFEAADGDHHLSRSGALDVAARAG